MADFMKKVTKLALKSAAVCAGVAASAALLHKYVKIQSNCSGCGPSEDDFDEDRNEDDTTKNVDEAANTEASEEESDAISSDEATDSSSRRYINIHVTGQNSDVDINIDKGQLLDYAAKLVADAAHLTKNLRPGAHSDKKADENKCEETAEEQTNDDSNFHFKHMNADSDIAELDIEDLSVDIDEDLSEGVSDLYAMDGVSEEDTAVDTKPLHEDDVNPEEKKEDTVNSSIHL